MRHRGRPRKDLETIKRFCANFNRLFDGKPHLTQTAIAEVLGVKRQAVSYWLSGQGMPNNKNLVKLAELLEVSVEELLS